MRTLLCAALATVAAALVLSASVFLDTSTAPAEQPRGAAFKDEYLRKAQRLQGLAAKRHRETLADAGRSLPSGPAPARRPGGGDTAAERARDGDPRGGAVSGPSAAEAPPRAAEPAQRPPAAGEAPPPGGPAASLWTAQAGWEAPEANCQLLERMCKHSDACGDGGGKRVAPLLVTSIGASGTLATWHKLEGAGLKLSGENGRAQDGNVAWTARCAGDAAAEAYMRKGERVTGWEFFPYRFEKVVHLVRHPIKAMSSYMHFSENMEADLNRKVWTYIEHFTEPKVAWRDDSGAWDHPVKRIAKHWITWNKMVAQVADSRVRVEDEDAPQRICESVAGGPALSGRVDCAKMRDLPGDYHSHTGSKRSHGKVTWELLRALDPALEREVWQMAQAYGYEREPPPRKKAGKAEDPAEEARERTRRGAVRKYRAATVHNYPSSAYDGHWPEHVLDGSPSSFYWSSGGPAHRGDFVEVDLQEPAVLSTVRVLHGDPRGRDRIRRGGFFVSERPCTAQRERPADFRKVGADILSNAGTEWTAQPPAEAVRCVRVELLDFQREWLAIREITLA